MNEGKRKQIKDKVAAGEARLAARAEKLSDRIGERAIEAKDGFTRFAREHPAATVAGGLALGVLVSALFRRSPTRRVASKAGSRAAGLAAMGAELAMAYAQQAMHAVGDARRAGAERLHDLEGPLTDTAHSLRRGASRQAGKASDSARTAGHLAGKAITRALRRIA